MLGNNKGIWLRQWGRQRSYVPMKQTLLEKCCLGSWRRTLNQTWNLTAKCGGQDEGWLVSEDVRVVPGNGWMVDPVIQDHTGPDHRPQLKESWRVMCVDGMRLEVDGGREVPTTWGGGGRGLRGDCCRAVGLPPGGTISHQAVLATSLRAQGLSRTYKTDF